MELFKFRMLIPAVPFPFEGEAVATNEKSAIEKVRWQAKKCGLKVFGEPFEIEKMAYIAEEAR